MNVRPGWFSNAAGGYEILFQPAEMDAAEQAAWDRLRQRVADTPSLSHATIEWIRVGVIVETEYLLLIRDAVRFPDGSLGTYERITSRPESGPGAAVLAMDREGQVLLLRHHRHALRQYLWEAPRGFSRPAEGGGATVIRELAEELQARVARLDALGSVAPDGGLLSDVVELFIAEIESIGDVERNEAINKVMSLPVQELHSRIARGEITDGFTLALYARAVASGRLEPPSHCLSTG